MKLPIRPLSMMFALTLSACGTSLSPSALQMTDDLEAGAQTRVHVSAIKFTNWNDTMQIDAGLTRDGDTCKVIQPGVTDDTTRWKPFQIFWAIRDDESDVTLGEELHDVFFAGDTAKASEFPGALGFAELNGQYASMLDLRSLTVSADGTTIAATIGSPFNVNVRVKAAPSADGCTQGTTFCKTSGDCSTDAQFRPLTSILVKQNFFGYPTEVVYN